MIMEREHLVSLLVGLIAIFAIIGGYASFTGLATAHETLEIDMAKSSFGTSEVLDINVIVRPVTLLADESIVIYLDNEPAGVIAIKKYLDDNSIDYGQETRNSGQNNVDVINLQERVIVNLADYVPLQHMHPGTVHVLRAELSQGDASVDAVFSIE